MPPGFSPGGFDQGVDQRNGDVIDAEEPRVFDSAQVVYNLLNPSAATALPLAVPRARDRGAMAVAVLATSGGADAHRAPQPTLPDGNRELYRASRLPGERQPIVADREEWFGESHRAERRPRLPIPIRRLSRADR